jgi:uncharacterized protein YdaU (DUF1376 family)
VEKSPAFQFYPKDFLSDEKQIQMSLAAVGIYIRLLCHCWNEGSLPADPVSLARLAGAGKKEFRTAWPSIQSCFQTTPEGRLVNPRMDRDRVSQTRFRSSQSRRAEARWAGEITTKVSKSLDNFQKPDAVASIRHYRNDAGPQCSSSSSSSSKEQIQIQPAAPANLSVSDEIADKAGRFLAKYPVIYAEERRGAHFPLKPVLHFHVACELVQGWPDLDRLELMLRTFCKLPASEKMAWPGTPAQFKHLAPSIDARLRQAGV